MTTLLKCRWMHKGTNAWLLPGISSSTASKGTIAKTPKNDQPLYHLGESG